MSDEGLKFLEIARELPEIRLPEVRLKDWGEVYKPFSHEIAQEQSSRCLSCGNPYCNWACPVHNHIPEWLDLLRHGKLFEAAELSHATNSLPEICGRICPQDRLCEKECTLNDGFGAVTIGAIEKYITDKALEEGWKPDLSGVKASGKRVAIVGSGPAGLGCADILTRNGVEVDVFDRNTEIGGLLTFGIPPFKLDKQVVKKRRAIMEEMGVRFHLGVEIGKDTKFNDLLEEYDAVFLGMGCYRSVIGPFEALDDKRVCLALPYLVNSVQRVLRKTSIGSGVDEFGFRGKSIIVLGGGDTAMDCVRTAVRHGAASVRCVYRRGEEQMPGSRNEIRNAKAEGVEFVFQQQPTGKMKSMKGHTVALEFAQTTVDADGKLQVNSQKNSELQCDSVILAFGFEPDPPAWFRDFDVKVGAMDRVCVSPSPFPFQTDNEKIFAGGDMVRGSDLVVTAVFEGRSAAEGILGYLNIH